MTTNPRPQRRITITPDDETFALIFQRRQQVGTLAGAALAMIQDSLRLEARVLKLEQMRRSHDDQAQNP